MEDRLPRKLAAILYADVAGYSRLTGEDEEGTHRRLSSYLDAFSASIQGYEGRVVHFAGDAILAEFPSVSQALTCAIAVQEDLAGRNEDLPEEQRILFRIGVNLGEVIVDRDDIYGDGVNVAARLESLAEPGGTCISESVYSALGTRLPLEYEYLGEQRVKNIEKPVSAYRVRLTPDAVLPEPSAVVSKAKHVLQPVAIAIVILLVVVGGLLTWLRPWAPSERPASVERMAFPLPDKPSIVVLPFDNLGSDAEREYLADGITETMIAMLSQIPEIFVISRNSSFTYKGKPVRVQQVAEDLGVRYVLEGSVQQSDDRVRITAQLIDAVRGHHLWSERYDRTFTDLFKLQDEIALKTIVSLQVELTLGEQARVFSRTTDNVRAWTYYAQAYSNFMKFSREGNIRARQLADEALALDPDFADAIIIVGFTHLVDARNGYGNSRLESLALAVELSNKAKKLAPEVPMLYNLEQSILRLEGELDAAVKAGERAIELSPSTSVSLLATAMTTHFAGEFDRSIELAKRAMRHNPHYSSANFIWLGWSNWFQGHYEQATAAANEGLRRAEDPAIAAAHHLTLALVYTEQGELDKARLAVAEARESLPVVSITFYRRGFPYKNAAHQARLLDTLRKAGLPE